MGALFNNHEIAPFFICLLFLFLMDSKIFQVERKLVQSSGLLKLEGEGCDIESINQNA